MAAVIFENLRQCMVEAGQMMDHRQELGRLGKEHETKAFKKTGSCFTKEGFELEQKVVKTGYHSHTYNWTYLICHVRYLDFFLSLKLA